MLCRATSKENGNSFLGLLSDIKEQQLNVPIVPGLKEKACKKSYSLYILFPGNAPHLCPHRKVNSACSSAPTEGSVILWDFASICFWR